MAEIERPLYMERLLSLAGTPDIKVITGIRRSGKSVLMGQLASRLKQEDPASNNVRIDLLNLDFEDLHEYHALHSYIEKHYREGVANRIFIDEVQLCPGFEKAINSIHAKGGWDIYLTGSNAFLLSSDLATLFTGRQREVHVLPFSFKEYRSYFQSSASPNHDLDSYLMRGGLAGSYAYGSREEAYDYIRDVFRTIITRDLVQKYSLPDTQVLERLAEYLMDVAGNIASPNGIASKLRSLELPANHVTIGRYISYLKDAFVFYEARRYDLKGRRYLETLSKYYLADTGMRYAVLGTRNLDWGHMYENLVFLELKRRGFEAYVGKLYQKEVDFVALKRGQAIYIQVSDDISAPETLEREASPLLKIKDANPKIIIARTRHKPYTYEGIRIIDLASWLAGEQRLVEGAD